MRCAVNRKSTFYTNREDAPEAATIVFDPMMQFIGENGTDNPVRVRQDSDFTTLEQAMQIAARLASLSHSLGPIKGGPGHPRRGHEIYFVYEQRLKCIRFERVDDEFRHGWLVEPEYDLIKIHEVRQSSQAA
jgi:hypothetical protein